MAKVKSKKNKWGNVLTKSAVSGVILASTLIPTIPLLSPIKAEASDTIYVTQNDSSKKMIESSQLRVWMQSTGRYGLQLKSNGATIFFSNDSAYLNITRNASFPNGYTYNQFANFSLKSFVINGTTIEQTRTDGVFDYIFRLSIVNATSQGAYMKAEVEMKNLTGSSQLVGASFNMDTKVNGNDQSPFRIIKNGWEAFNDGVQVTAYYQDVFNVTNADSIYLGHYSSQYPMPVNSFYEGQVIYPGDSGAGFYYNPKYVGAYQSRKESWIMGMGPRNANPTFTMTAPADNQTFYRGQTLPISGYAQDTDVGDLLEVKWAIDGGVENVLTSFRANGTMQPFNYNYTLPSNLTEGWHTLQVWVMDDKGGVSSSNTKRFYINNFVAPGKPTFSNVKNDSFTVSFDKKGNVDSTTYELYRVNDGKTFNLGTKNSLNETGFSPNERYQYKVRAKNTSNVYTGYSEIGSIYTLANKPTAGNLDSSVQGQVVFDWGKNGNPEGTKYRYEVRKNDNSLVKSGETTSNSATVTGLPTDVNYKVYVKALNGDNVGTEETYIGEFIQDTIPPSLALTATPNDWTNGSVTINVKASDAQGVAQIQLPNGNIINGTNESSFVVEENGEYTFKATDDAGNTTEKVITINKIDKVAPTATHSIEHVSGDTYNIKLRANDDASGIKSITLPNGDIINGETASYNLKKGENYEFIIEDKAGNQTTYKILAVVPELEVFQKDNFAKADWSIDMDNLVNTQLFRNDTKVYEGLDSSYEDKDAIDKAKPNRVSTVKVEAREGTIYMDIQRPEDNGTEYEYMVKAIDDNGDVVSSERKKVTVKTGIDGYSYVVDTNASTIPDDSVDTQSDSVEIPIANNAKYYIHIKSIDKEGNTSDVTHIPFQDNVAPTMKLSQNPTEWTSSPVQITVEATDVGLGMKRIKLPDGNWVEGDNATFNVSKNGVYTFVAEDLVGNQTTKSITVSNIDTTPPTSPTIVNNQEWTKTSPVSVTIRPGTDNQSGVKRTEYKLEGATIQSWTTYNGLFNVLNEGETKITARTIDKLDQPSSESVSYVRIDKSPPFNIGITIKLKPFTIKP